MKPFIAILLAGFSYAGVAAFLPPPSESMTNIDIPAGEARIKGYRFGACDYWVTNNSPTGGTSYACGFYPNRVTVADGYDVADALTEMAKKIEVLEAKVAELEKKPQK